MPNRPLNVGLVGGGKGAFIVHPHQKAIHFDGTRRVVAGALFPDPKIALEEAANWPYPIKGYGSYDEMIAANASLPADQKLDYILIVTPNFVHHDPAMKAMKAGIAVFCEKPLCLNLKEADDLVKTARKLNVPFGVACREQQQWRKHDLRQLLPSHRLQGRWDIRCSGFQKTAFHHGLGQFLRDVPYRGPEALSSPVMSRTMPDHQQSR